MSEPSAQPILFLISAPSGAGKTTLLEGLLASCRGLERVITCTTRAPREGERDGVDYHFLDAPSFEQRVKDGHFLEHATVYGNRYGTLKSEVMQKLQCGIDVLLSVDVQGAASIRTQAESDAGLRSALVTLFLSPVSFAVLEKRLRGRGTDAEAVVNRRLGVARQEAAQWKQFDYLLPSGTVEEDLQKALAVIRAEKMRTNRCAWPAL